MSDQASSREQAISQAVANIIANIDDDPFREGLMRTPKRCTEALMAFTAGYHRILGDIVNGAFSASEYTGLVVVRDIQISSMCEHHLLPFIGKMHIGYVPNGTVIDLSKLPRIAEMFSQRLQTQERLTQQVMEAIQRTLQPHGVAVICECTHLCMAMRGVQKLEEAKTTTSSALGSLQAPNNNWGDFIYAVGPGRLT